MKITIKLAVGIFFITFISISSLFAQSFASDGTFEVSGNVSYTSTTSVSNGETSENSLGELSRDVPFIKALWIKMNKDYRSEVSLKLNQSEKYSEQLFSEDEIFDYSINSEKLNQTYKLDINNLLRIPPTNFIQKMKIERSTSLWNHIKYGSLIGAAVGLVGGLMYTTLGNVSRYEGAFGGIAKFGDVITGMTIGIGVGLIGGIIVGILNQ